MIKFPKVHIATSVVNRILNIVDGLEPQNSAARAIGAQEPRVPDTAGQSLALDRALGTEPPELPPIDEAPDTGATLAGSPLLSTILKPGA